MFEAARKEGNFTLSSGRKSKYFYDFDLLMPREHIRAVSKLIELCDGLHVEAIVAPAVGGIIPGFLTAKAKDAKLVIVTKDGEVRGPKIFNNYLVVDDVITSFGTIDKVVKAVEREHSNGDAKPKVLGVAAYIFRGSDKDIENGIKKFTNVKFIERKEEEE